RSFIYTIYTHLLCSSFFFFHATAPTEIYTLSLHDALPICYLYDVIDGPDGVLDIGGRRVDTSLRPNQIFAVSLGTSLLGPVRARSEEHTSELQSLRHLVCRLLLEKKKKKKKYV